ncbi:hypothetical protein ACFL20_06525 [Spirochaetota bacterium]
MSIKDYMVKRISDDTLNDDIDTSRSFCSYYQDQYTDNEIDEYDLSMPEYDVLELMDDVYDVYSIKGKVTLGKDKFFNLSIDDLALYIESEAKKLKAKYNGNNYERKRWTYRTRLMTRKKLESMQKSGSDIGIPVKSFSDNNYGKVYFRSGKFIIEFYESDEKTGFSSIDEFDSAGYVID